MRLVGMAAAAAVAQGREQPLEMEETPFFSQMMARV